MSNSGKGSPGRGSWYQRVFARAMNTLDQSEYEAHKRALLGDLHGTVLEIGPGTGVNLAYYPRDAHWIGLEPNPAMHPYIERAASKLGRTVELRQGQAERLDLPDESVDAVVSTLVMCSVDDQRRALQEIRRVLKPGGRYVFIEHVAAPRASGLRRVQSFIKPVWQVFGDGCQPDRETWATIEDAGFSSVQLEHFRVATPIVAPHIAGVAVK